MEVETARQRTGQRMPRQHLTIHESQLQNREQEYNIHRSIIQCNHNKQQDCAMSTIHARSTANNLQQRIYRQQRPLAMETYSHSIAKHNIFPRHSTWPWHGQLNQRNTKKTIKIAIQSCRTSKQQVWITIAYHESGSSTTEDRQQTVKTDPTTTWISWTEWTNGIIKHQHTLILICAKKHTWAW